MRAFILIIAGLLMAGCGGGSAPMPYIQSDHQPEPEIQQPQLGWPVLVADNAEQSPVFYRNTTLHVGTEVSPASGLKPVANRPGTSYGQVRDGEGAESVSSYMAEFAGIGEFKGLEGHEIFPSAPTVHIAQGASDRHTTYVVKAVQLINENLPVEKHIRIGDDVPPLITDIDDIPDGTIYVDFAPWEAWPGERNSGMGMADHSVRYNGDFYVQRAAHVWVEPNDVPDHTMLKVLVHEIMHAIGFKAHISRADTVMPGVGNTFWTENLDRPLYPVDREGILAAYTRLEPGDNPATIYEKLGAWEDVSTHLTNATDVAEFGVAYRNGFVRPWARGKAPNVNLADGPLRGKVEWHGDLLGFAPGGASVAGDAAIGVNLPTLTGQANFTSLESWTPWKAPGIAGSGAQWSDGDLAYSIAIIGNTFQQTGGDDGVITGAFFGESHNGVGGTLKRSDLPAAFGGRR